MTLYAPVSAIPYKVRITATDLHIRKGPNTDSDIVRYIKPGVYTIVEESNGPGATKWGRLKSGAGWISLDHAKKQYTCDECCERCYRSEPFPCREHDQRGTEIARKNIRP